VSEQHAATAVAPTDSDWHHLDTSDVLERLGAADDGLPAAEAEARLAREGPNRLPQPKRKGPVARFLGRFNNLLIQLLLGAAAVTALLGHWIDTMVILAVVLINAVISQIQEGKAEEALAAIRDLLAPRATVLRDGRRATVEGESLVPGDVVLLESGDRVPADLRMLEARGLRVQEAVLTGESVPVEKATTTVARDAPLGDRSGMAFSGTMVAAGQGKGVVVATGGATEIGRISGLLSSVQTLTTPLLRQMDTFARWLAIFVIGLGIAILGFGLLVRNYPFDEIFMAVVGIAVAAIPEGLPAILTVTLAIGVQGMARRNAIVRQLPAIETLGSVSVICSDKTGTLTRNEMTVATVVTGTATYRVSGTGYEPLGEFTASPEGAGSASAVVVDAASDPLLLEIVQAGLLCSDATLESQDGTYHAEGDPMEGALVVVAMKACLEPEDERRGWPRADAIPFDAQHRFMATLNHDHAGQCKILVKGAPERLLDMCAGQRCPDAGGRAPLDRERWESLLTEIADDGQRVIAVAVREVPAGTVALSFDDVEGGLTLLGLFGLIDPPRDEAIVAVADCHAAGIGVKMITGDHAGTAAAIARRLGLPGASDVVTGADIDRLDDATLRSRVLSSDVFARTSPEHKLRLVEALQAGGEVVAMTGDGVNDAPALKRADVGIAMGGKGSEAAKEAAEMVLADDNFATIAAAVRAGRAVYDNLKKAIMFLLPVNGGESLCLIAAILAGVPLPITPVQILWVNMVSSVALAMALAFEPPEPDVMRRAPRPAGEPILSGLLAWRILFVSVLFAVGVFGMYELAIARGAEVTEARTVAVNTLVAMEVFYLFSVRFLSASSITLRGILGNRPVMLAVTAVVVLQMVFTYAPFMNTFFGTKPLAFTIGLQVVAAGAIVLVVLEVEKAIRRLIRGTLPARVTP
jgi:magnesium-transporting ATPase (P-type)